MTRTIFTMLFTFLGLSFSSQASQYEEPTNLLRARVAVGLLAGTPALDLLINCNKHLKPLADEDLAKLNVDQLRKVSSRPVGYELANWSLPVNLGLIPAMQEEVKQSLILWAKLIDYIPPDMKTSVLSTCQYYKAWYNNEYPEVSDAVTIIRKKYHAGDNTMPVWHMYGLMSTEEKLVFHLTTIYSLPAGNVYIRYATFSFLALMAYLYFK